MDCAKGVGARLARPNKSLAKMEGILPSCTSCPAESPFPPQPEPEVKQHWPLSSPMPIPITNTRSTISGLIPHYHFVLELKSQSDCQHNSRHYGMDALTHAIEAYIGRSTTEQTREAAIERSVVFRYLPVAYKMAKPDSKKRNAPRLLSGRYCITPKVISGYVHAVAHSLGGQYGIRMNWQTPFFFDRSSKRTERRHLKLAHLLDHQTFRLPRTIPPQPMLLSHISENERFHEHPDDPCGIRNENVRNWPLCR